MDIKYTLGKAKTAELMNSKCSLLELIEESIPEHYWKECEILQHYEMPVRAEDGTVLSRAEDISAAFANGEEEMSVMNAEGLTRGNFTRFALKNVYFFNLSDKKRFELIQLISEEFKTPEGEQWSQEMSDAGYKDINDKLGVLLNCDKETIKRIKRLNKPNPRPTENIDEKDVQVSLTEISYKGQRLECNNIKFKKKIRNGVLIIEVPLKSHINCQG